MHTYNLALVIANLLHTRKDQVLLVTPSIATATGSSSQPHQSSEKQPTQGSNQEQKGLPLTMQVRQQQDQTEQQAASSLHGACGGQHSSMGVSIQVIDRAQEEKYIEKQLVAEVVRQHLQFRITRNDLAR